MPLFHAFSVHGYLLDSSAKTITHIALPLDNLDTDRHMTTRNVNVDHMKQILCDSNLTRITLCEDQSDGYRIDCMITDVLQGPGFMLPDLAHRAFFGKAIVFMGRIIEYDHKVLDYYMDLDDVNMGVKWLTEIEVVQERIKLVNYVQKGMDICRCRLPMMPDATATACR